MSKPRPQPESIELDLDLPGPPASGAKPSAPKPAPVSSPGPISRPGPQSKPSPISRPGPASQPSADSLKPDDEDGIGALNIELADEPRPSAPRASGPSRPSPTPGDDEIDMGAMPIELGDAPASRRTPTAKRSSPGQGPPSSRRIHLHRHTKEENPRGIGAALAAAGLTAALTVITPFIHPAGVALVQSWLAGTAYLPYVVLALLVIGVWAVVISRAVHASSTALHLSAAALVVHLICLALITAAVVTGSNTPKAFLRLMPTVAPIATAVVTLGFCLRGLGRVIDELRGDRRIGVSALLVLLTLAGAALGVRTARYDLPLPRLGESTNFVVW